MPAPDATRPPAPVEALRGFELVTSSDPAKTDLEVRCTACHEHLCDAEPGDDLATLVLVTLGHECGAPASADEPAGRGAHCRSTSEPVVRHDRTCDRHDGWCEGAPMLPHDALSLAMLALNTLADPAATTPGDLDALDTRTDEALDALVRLRDTLAAPAPGWRSNT